MIKENEWKRLTILESKSNAKKKTERDSNLKWMN